DQGSRLLHIATNRCYLEVVRVLLDHNADVNSVDDCGRHPLYLAIERQNPLVVEALLDASADANQRFMDDCTPLHAAACASDSPSIVRLLLERGATVD
ncbi:ankyrin, partial [Aulographum hederae CBS 113979]